MRNDSNDRPREYPKPIGGIIDQLIARLGISRSYYGWRVVNQWPEIVGEYNSKHSKAVRFDNGTLYVAVPDASWRQVMAMEQHKILAKIQALPHGRAVREIRLIWSDSRTEQSSDSDSER